MRCSKLPPHWMFSKSLPKYYLLGAFSFLVSLYLLRHLYSPANTLRLVDEHCNPPETAVRPALITPTGPPKRHRIAIASRFGFHHDVYMTLAWSLSRAMNHTLGNVEVYAEVPFTHHFQDVVDGLHLYGGEYRHPNALVPSLRSQADDSAIDMVVLGTCEIDLRGDWANELLAAWDERDEDHKFQLVCIVHNTKDDGWQPGITEWALRSAIRLIAISEHVANSFLARFSGLADDFDLVVRSTGYENIKVDVHVPILPLSSFPERPSPPRVLSKAVIQGSFDTVRRDYAHIFSDLSDSLHEDPAAWGYSPLGNEQSFISNNSTNEPSFQLFLLGSGYLDIPMELRNVVVVKSGLTYPEFYDLMSQMDICVPAFSPSGGYYHEQASSTFAMALQCNVPILVTNRTRKSYMYADDDRVVVTRPAAMREISALKALRTGHVSWFLNKKLSDGGRTIGSNSLIDEAVAQMVTRGWTRTNNDFVDFRDSLWRRNEVLAQRLIRDL